MRIEPEHVKILCDIVEKAGEKILPFYQAEHSARAKADKSPVTDADIAAHDYILERLSQEFPDITVVSEEDNTHTVMPEGATFFLVDPLDGTRSFVAGEPEFTVNIGLIVDHKPTFGVVGVPVKGDLYWGGIGIAPKCKRSGDKEGKPIAARIPPEAGMVLTRSKSSPSTATQDFLDSLPIESIIPASSSIKLCWLAEGTADVYPRFGRTMEWDIAAGHAILNAAGGSIAGAGGKPFLYGKPGYENSGFVARGKQKQAA